MVLSGFRGHSVLVSGLMPRNAGLSRRNASSVIALTNQAIDSFQNDYTQARAAYFSTLQTPKSSEGTNAQEAFQLYTKSRVYLLGQQITSNLLASSAALGEKTASLMFCPV